MPTIKENQQKWGTSTEWLRAGEQWSDAWGGPERQWNRTILPRIRQFLPATTILEIAPGFGRWTHFLKDHCERLIGVDLNQNCVEECRKRFGSSPNLSFFQNDGKSLEMLADASVDFVFSFDSLVHAEVEVLDGYLSQFRRILKPNGAAFLHHSNYGAHVASPFAMLMTRIPIIRRAVMKKRLLGVKPNWHWRAESVSAATVRDLCRKHHLGCSSQELVNWDIDYLNDCFSTINPDEHSDTVIAENPDFMAEAAAARRAGEL